MILLKNERAILSPNL